MDVLGLTDPYVRVTVGAQSQKTSTKMATLEPFWDETLEFKLSPTDVMLKIAVYDWDAGAVLPRTQRSAPAAARANPRRLARPRGMACAPLEPLSHAVPPASPCQLLVLNFWCPTFDRPHPQGEVNHDFIGFVDVLPSTPHPPRPHSPSPPPLPLQGPGRSTRMPGAGHR
jgi:hypothetical protein